MESDDYPTITPTQRRPEPATAFDREVERHVARITWEMEHTLYAMTARAMGVPADSDIATTDPFQARTELLFGIGPSKPKVGMRTLLEPIALAGTLSCEQCGIPLGQRHSSGCDSVLWDGVPFGSLVTREQCGP